MMSMAEFYTRAVQEEIAVRAAVDEVFEHEVLFDVRVVETAAVDAA